MKKDEIIGGIILLILGLITALLSLQMPIGTFRAAGTGMFPLILGVFLMILSGVFLLNILLVRKKEPGKKEFETGKAAILVELQRKGMQVIIPDAESFRAKAKPAVEELFKTQWSVTTWAEVLAQ